MSSQSYQGFCNYVVCVWFAGLIFQLVYTFSESWRNMHVNALHKYAWVHVKFRWQPYVMGDFKQFQFRMKPFSALTFCLRLALATPRYWKFCSKLGSSFSKLVRIIVSIEHSHFSHVYLLTSQCLYLAQIQCTLILLLSVKFADLVQYWSNNLSILPLLVTPSWSILNQYSRELSYWFLYV